MTPVVPLAILRDLALRVPLPSELADEVHRVTSTNVQPLQGEEAARFVASALALTDRCIEHLEGEIRRLNEQRFSAPDPNALRQRLLAEPRRQADGAVASLKQRLSAERQEWVRRVAKQLNDVQAGLEQQIESLEIKELPQQGAIVAIGPDDEWLRAYDAWRNETYSRWASHLSGVLPTKTRKAIEVDLQALGAVLGRAVTAPEHPAPPFRLPHGREAPREYRDKFDVPTAFEAFFDSFKDRLNTVAMIAGLVVIPVIGSLMHTASTQIRAAVMGACIAPIVLFSVLQGRRHRKKLYAQNLDKARERLRKTLAQDAKTELDRFKLDAERYTSAYCASSQQVFASALEPEIARHFEALEKQVARNLADAQVESDRWGDQLTVARQLKTGLSGQLVLELRRREADLRASSDAKVAV